MYGLGCVKIDTPQTYNWTPFQLYVSGVYFDTPQTLVDGRQFNIPSDGDKLLDELSQKTDRQTPPNIAPKLLNKASSQKY